MEQTSAKTVSKIALTSLAILLIGSIVFMKERLFFADTSFIAFLIINGGSLAIMNQRYGSFITQIVPYIGQKLHLPLSYILAGYAASFYLFFFVAGLLIVYRYKQYTLAILMSLYYFLLVSDSYFLANDEIHQGIAWMFLLYAVIIHLENKHTHFVILLLPFITLLFLAVSSHFIAIIPTVFLWVYLVIEKKNWPFTTRKTIWLSCILVATVLFKFTVIKSQPYENSNLYGATHFSLQDIIDTFSSAVVQSFFARCITNYWAAVVVFILGCYSLLRNRQKLLFTWYVLSVTGYIVLMGLAFASQDQNFLLCHVETEWASIGIIISAPFVFSFLQSIKTRSAVLVFSLLFLIRFAYIGNSYNAFRWRTVFKENVLTQMRKKKIPKLAIYMDSTFVNKTILYWAFPFESLMQSALAGDKPQFTFFLLNKDDQNAVRQIDKQCGFFDGYTSWYCTYLNPAYFSIDTSAPYQKMTYEDLMK